MSKMADYIIQKVEEIVSEAAQKTKYTAEFLWDMWDEIQRESSGDFESDIKYFRGVTMEMDW